MFLAWIDPITHIWTQDGCCGRSAGRRLPHASDYKCELPESNFQIHQPPIFRAYLAGSGFAVTMRMGIPTQHRRLDMASLIEHLFVLMLENRAFDHMLGFSGITGLDAVTGDSTQIDGLTGSEFNNFNGSVYRVRAGADNVMPVDPGHEFTNVLVQLCGAGATYAAGGTYPAINNTGFVASYAASGGAADPGEVMKCFAPAQLPVLVALAQEFAVCDNWHASMPGPTWPNRMFVHAGSSGGLDHSPTTQEIVGWETIGGFQFKAGSIFDALKQKGVSHRIYAGDDFPMVAALKGISLSTFTTTASLPAI